MEVNILGSLKPFIIPWYKSEVYQKPDTKGVRLDRCASSSHGGYPTCGSESCVVVDDQESKDSTTPVGWR